MAAIEESKMSEIKAHSISGDEWTGLKRDIPQIVSHFAIPKGFLSKRNRFSKTIRTDLVFEIRVDIGGNPESGTGNQLKLNVFHKSEPKFVFEATLLDKIVPGFWRYGVCESRASHVLGIMAYVEMFDVLADTLLRG